MMDVYVWLPGILGICAHDEELTSRAHQYYSEKLSEYPVFYKTSV